MGFDIQTKHWCFSVWTNWQRFMIGADWVYLGKKKGGLVDFNLYIGPIGLGWIRIN